MSDNIPALDRSIALAAHLRTIAGVADTPNAKTLREAADMLDLTRPYDIEIEAFTSKTVIEAAAALAEKMPKGPALSSFHAYAEVVALRRALESAAHETTGNPVETALRGLYWDQVDYLTLNKLGGLDNHWMRAARDALGIQRSCPIPGNAELRLDSPEIQFSDVFDELDKGHPVNARDAINALWWKVRNQRREIARLHERRAVKSGDDSLPDRIAKVPQ